MADEQPTLEMTDASSQPVVTQDASSQTSIPTDGVESAQTAPAQPAAVHPVAQPQDDYRTKFAESSREALRLYHENRQLQERLTQSSQPAKPQTYSAEQLETWKAGYLVQQAQAAAGGDLQKAQEAAQQVILIDRELRKQEVQSYTQQTQRETAQNTWRAETAPVIQKLQADLVPGNPLYEKAAQLYTQAVAAGSLPNDLTLNQAIITAAALTGKFTQSLVQDTRKEFTTQVQHKLKEAVLAGSGGSTAGTRKDLGAEDINAMSDADFAKFHQAQLAR
jgi:hypothetical protein